MCHISFLSLSPSGRPVFTLTPFNIQVSNGSRAVIPCSVTGVPPPYVTWTVVSNSVGGEGISFMCSG